MNVFTVCGLTVLLCALGTDASLAGIVGNRLGKTIGRNVLQDVADTGVECTPNKKYTYAETKCAFLECIENTYELVKCTDGLGVTEGFKDTNTNPCSRSDSDCLKTLAEKGVVNPDVESCGIDLCFIVDMSFSISDINKVKVRTFISNLAKKLNLGGDRTFLTGLTYGAETDVFLKLNTYNSGGPMLKAIRNMKVNPKKGTATELALREAREVLLSIESGRRKGKKSVCMVLTDGVTNPIENSPTTVAEAEKLKDPKSYEDGVSPPHVILLDLPNIKLSDNTVASEKAKLEAVKTKEFAAIPSDSDSHFKLNSFDELEDQIQSILRKSCTQL